MLGHTKLILWTMDSQQKKMSRAIFFFQILIFSKNEASEKETFF